jgi:probable F420-dependent oxidoreductase
VTGPVQFGIALPQSSAAGERLAEATAGFVHSAERYGLHSLWVQEQTIGTDPSLEPIVNLAYVAAITTTIRLGTAAIIAPARNPVVLAKQLGSLDRLSGGRLIVGLAIGDMPSLYDASGVPVAGRGERMEEVIRVLKGLWTRPEFSYESASRSIVAAGMEPKPVQRPHPPLWFGGRSSGALERALREGDGWVSAGGTSIAKFAELAGGLRTTLHEQGRDDFSIAKKLYIAVEDSRELARERLADWFSAHWTIADDPRALAESVGVFGTAEDCAEAIARVAQSDPNLIILNPVYGEQEQLARLAETVLPLLGR